LVKSGEVRAEQATGWAKMLFDASRENRQEITRFIRSEMQNQVQGLGLATKQDLDRLERRVSRVESSVRLLGAKKTTAKKTTGRKVAAKKPTAKKTTGRKPSAGRTVPPRRSGGGEAGYRPGRGLG
jgi:polyhydroxyalkanoate synthesis regulator phasin